VEHSPIKKSAVGDQVFGEVITLRDPDNVQLELYTPAE
jgi:hypothetical protein